jgi:hypothetical protein
MRARWRGFLRFAIDVFAINNFAAGDFAIDDRAIREGRIGDRAQAGCR